MDTETKETHQYKMGFDCAMNGANENNCNYKLFDTPEHKNLWEMGKRAAELEQAKKAVEGDL